MSACLPRCCLQRKSHCFILLQLDLEQAVWMGGQADAQRQPHLASHSGDFRWALRAAAASAVAAFLSALRTAARWARRFRLASSRCAARCASFSCMYSGILWWPPIHGCLATAAVRENKPENRAESHTVRQL